MTETWLPTPGFEETHEVSDLGRVRSVRRPGRRSGMILRPWIDPKGYVRVTILGKTKKMHRLVLAAFDRLPLAGEEGAHSDGNPANNAATNLRWKNPVENCVDRLRHGSLASGERHGAAKLTNADVTRIRSLRAQGKLWKEIHDDYPMVSRSTLIEAGTGTTFRHLNGPAQPSPRAIRMRHKRSGSSSVST